MIKYIKKIFNNIPVKKDMKKIHCLSEHIDGNVREMKSILTVRIDSHADHTLYYCDECGLYWFHSYYENPASGGGIAVYYMDVSEKNALKLIDEQNEYERDILFHSLESKNSFKKYTVEELYVIKQRNDYPHGHAPDGSKEKAYRRPAE